MHHTRGNTFVVCVSVDEKNKQQARVQPPRRNRVTIDRQVSTALGLILSSLEKFSKAIDSHGQRINGLSDYSDRIVALEQCNKTIKDDNTRILDKVEDLENRSRRSNLRIVGIPEKTKAQDPVSFMSSPFAEVLGSDFFPTPPVLNRAQSDQPRRIMSATGPSVYCVLSLPQRYGTGGPETGGTTLF
ncbi:hypothetical protein NHX12_002669 [Muraenolepis orangiensis]|uniref:Uncharacterized protein n=1 Tax=Muraenolepis orangiensis TaxID=630683 RepID=A0A9Q0IFG6_9TELE|nr:hypothetical protein NHX12_002669 [Muraenolepis orangiensis]